MPVVTRSMTKRGLLDIERIEPEEDTRWRLSNFPHVLEMIMKYVSNKTDLLNCRLVNSTWNESATYVIQKQLLSSHTAWKWTTFNAPPSPKGFTSSFPCVFINQLREVRQLLAAKPQSGIDLVSNEVNPIITNSLRLIRLRNDSCSPRELFRASKIFKTHGSILTSLCLEGIAMTPKEAVKILPHLANLVALDLNWLSLVTNSKEDNIPKWESFLPKLTHVSSTCAKDTWMLDWLLKHVASQLIGLKCCCCTVPNNIDERPFIFEKLKELSVSSHRKRELIFDKFQAPNLERLNFNGNGDLFTFEDILGLISQFSSSLVELRLDAAPRSFIEDLKSDPFGKSGRVTFPKMMSFSYYLRNVFIEPSVLEYLTLFLSIFPNLKTLNISFETYDHYGAMELLGKAEALAVCQQSDIWNFCAKLETVRIMHVKHCCKSRIYRRCLQFTREEMEQELQ